MFFSQAKDRTSHHNNAMDGTAHTVTLNGIAHLFAYRNMMLTGGLKWKKIMQL